MCYKIAVLPYYYAPDIRGENQPRILNVEFNSVEDAQNYIDEIISNVYYLEHNEYSAPDYFVIATVDADYIETGRNYDASNYDWDDADCDCGECYDCINMMISQDREYLNNNKL